MSMRYKGGVISATAPSTSQASAPGIWTLEQQFQAQGSSTWPIFAPVANFTGTPTSGTAPLTVSFTDTSTNTPTSWLWDFKNDGTATSTSQNPSYTYTTGGTFSVKLTATNAAGSNSFTRTNYITVTAVAYRYYRWLITNLKNGVGSGIYVQAAEFVFRVNGVDQSMSGVTVTNPGGSNPGGETPPNLVDNNLSTKWLDFNIQSSPYTSTIIFDCGSAKTFNGYSWATANDSTERDPASWTLAGSNDNSTWTTLSTVSNFVATNNRNTWNPGWTY